jgi:FkbM family methyltransferase
MSFDVSPRMWFGVDEPWVAQSAKQHVQSGAVVYDIGAHVGYTCLLYAQRVGSDGEVHAFEILPSIVDQYLAATIQANPFRNIVTHAVGLSDREETISLPIGDTLMTSQEAVPKDGQRVEECRVVALDQYVASNDLPLPAYMKIDIEKAEVDCLIGGENTIRQSSPMMMIEFHSKELLEDGHALLGKWGYRLITQRGEIVDPQMIHDLTSFHESVLCLPSGTAS